MNDMIRCEVGAPGADPSRSRPLSTTILRLIWDEEHISRADIARRLDVSRSTVSEIVDALLPTGLVAEAGVGASSGGRRPIVLAFQYQSFSLLGVDVGASHVSVVLTDLISGRLAASVLAPAKSEALAAASKREPLIPAGEAR